MGNGTKKHNHKLDNEPEKKPTDKQIAILLYIADTIDSVGVSPPYRKIAARFGIGVTTAFSRVGGLRILGLVMTANDADYGIIVTVDGHAVVEEWRAKTVEIT